MKSFRVTLHYSINGHAGCISSVVPAFIDDQALNKVIDANSLAGQVTASKVEQVN